MRTRTRTLLAILIATLVLASALNTASARNLSISSSTFRTIWAPLIFSSSPGGAGITLTCRLTLEGSFHYTRIVKVARSLIGWVTKAVVAPACGGGQIYADNGVENPGLAEGARPNTLPWHVTYEAFTGRLPEITGIRLLLRPVFVVNAGLLCRYSGNLQLVLNPNGAGEVATVTPDSTIGAPKISGGVLCPATGYFTNPATITVLNSGAFITIRLI